MRHVKRVREIVKHRDFLTKSRCFAFNAAVSELKSPIARMRYVELPFKLPLPIWQKTPDFLILRESGAT